MERKQIIIKGGIERVGQKMFNFLEWLNCEKGIPTNQSSRLADPFFIDDEEMEKYWNEYNYKQNV